MTKNSERVWTKGIVPFVFDEKLGEYNYTYVYLFIYLINLLIYLRKCASLHSFVVLITIEDRYFSFTERNDVNAGTVKVSVIPT